MIGLWIARYQGDKPVTLAHFCESEIADRKVIRCGRQMAATTVMAPTSEIREAVGVRACRRCGPR